MLNPPLGAVNDVPPVWPANKLITAGAPNELLICRPPGIIDGIAPFIK